MKYFFTLLLCGFVLPLFGQTTFSQTGQVRAFNSGKKPVSNTQIIFSNAALTTSDASGKFHLIFTDKKSGDCAFKAEIAQKGYELVNEKAIECVKLSRDTQAYLDIVVAKTGTIARAQKAYYAVLDSTLKTHYFEEKVKLKAGRFNSPAAKRVYQDEYEALQKQYSHQKQALNALSEEWARVNNDDVNGLCQDVLQLIREGNIEDALNRLDKNGLLERISRYAKTKSVKTSVEDSIKALNNFKADLAAVELQAHLYLMTFKKYNAELLYDQIFVFDSTNLHILRGCAAFYTTINDTDKALNIYAKILAHRSLNTPEKAHYFLEGGDALTSMGEFDEAVNAFTQCKNIYLQWLKENPNAPFIKHKLSGVYLRLGNAHLALNHNTDKAIVFYRNYQQFAQELSDIYPNSNDYKSNLALSQERLGRLQTHLGDLTKALSFYNAHYLLRKALSDADPNNLDLKNALALACEKLGTVHRDLKQFDKAFIYFEQFDALKTAIYADDIQDIEAKNNAALAHAKLGAAYQALGNNDKALAVYIEYNRLAKELYTENLNNVDFTNSLMQSFARLAETHVTLNNLDKALVYCEERLKLNQELLGKYPNNKVYKNNLAAVYAKLGTLETQLGDLDKALVFYEKDMVLCKELCSAHPKNVHFKNALALSYAQFGTFYKEQKKDKVLADTYFAQGKALLSELVATTPTSTDYKNNLKWVEGKLAEK